jgi:hypothetical protein
VSETSDKTRIKTFLNLETGSGEESREAVVEETVLFTVACNFSFVDSIVAPITKRIALSDV